MTMDDDNIEDGFENEENYYTFLNIPTTASLFESIIVKKLM